MNKSEKADSETHFTSLPLGTSNLSVICVRPELQDPECRNTRTEYRKSAYGVAAGRSD